jgi:hypothetical protein
MYDAHRIAGRIGIAIAAWLTLVATAAHADTLWIEAEDNDEQGGPTAAVRTITSPMQIVDRADASGGSSIQVENGLDSKTSVPATGRACYTFSIETAGTYKVWGRVIARTVDDDSFWVRMDNGSWIKWNEIALGADWHWDFVHDDVANTTPITFSLTAASHTLCVAYREDDTRLDVLVVTSDTSFDPRSAVTGAPAAPLVVNLSQGNLTNRVEWMTSLGATSYTVERRVSFDLEAPWLQQATGITGHTFTQDGLTDNELYCYRVIATGPGGTSAPSDNPPCANAFTGEFAFAFSEDLSLTAPLQLTMTDFGLGFGVSPGHNSLNAAPSSGYARFDFKLAVAGMFKAHAQVTAPNPDSDSFWVRVDGGAWIKWNNIVPGPTCGYANVRNSDAGGASMNYSLGVGSHNIEFAYREEGAKISKVLVTNGTETFDVGPCFD